MKTRLLTLCAFLAVCVVSHSANVNFTNMRLTYDQVDPNNGRTMLQLHYTLTVTGLQGHTLVPVMAVEIPQGTFHKFASGQEMKSEGNQLVCNYASTTFNNQWQAIYIDALNPLPGKRTYYARIYLVDMTLGRQIAQSNYFTFTNVGEQSNQQKNQSQQQQQSRQPQQQQKAQTTKKVFRETAYPSGVWFIPATEEEPLQVEITIQRERGNGTQGDSSEWGSFSAFTDDAEFDGTITNPSKVGEVYYFDIKSNKGTGRIGLQKKLINGFFGMLNVVESSGAVAGWLKKGMSLGQQMINGNLYDPTLNATTEAELAEVMKDINDDNLNNYVWWMKLLYPNDANAIMSHLSFEPQSKKFIRPKSSDVRIRAEANTKSEVLSLVNQWDILPVDGETAGWYDVRKGWISKTVVQPVTFGPITPDMMNTNLCGGALDLDTSEMWRVQSPVGKTGLALCEMNSFGMKYLRLGKMVGNILVFKYRVEFECEIDEQNPKTFQITMGKGIEGRKAIVKVGTDYCVRLTLPDYQPWAIDLSRFSTNGLLKMFEEEIANNYTDYWYMGSELLTGDYANFSLW